MQQVVDGLGWLREWQFLVASMIVLLAGAITVRAINRQIKQRQFEVADGRQRLLRTLRANLPDDLDRLSAYARRSADAAREAVIFLTRKEEGREDQAPKRRKRPTLPAHVLRNLKGLIENLDPDNADQLADLLECYHLQHARVVSAINNFRQLKMNGIEVPRDINFNPVFKHTLELYLRTKDILPFARGETEKIVISFGPPQVLAALRELNIESVISPEAREYCVQFLSGEKAQGADSNLRRNFRIAS